MVERLVKALPVRLQRLAYRLGWWVRTAWWLVRRPHVVGVKAILRDGDRVLFVRHAYGSRRTWALPGGALQRREAPADAVRREAREELGVDIASWRPLGALQMPGLGRTTTLHAFVAELGDEAVAFDRGELAEVRWAPIGDPPKPFGRDVPAILRRLG